MSGSALPGRVVAGLVRPGGAAAPYAALNAVLLGVLAVLGLVHLAGFLGDAVLAVRTPVELDYGEGIVWQQAALIPGPLAYRSGPGLPFIVFHYTPLFYVAARAAAWFMPDLLAAGRLVSVVSTVLLLPVLGWIAVLAVPDSARRRPAVLLAVAACCLLPLSLVPVRYWGVLMRVDMLGLLLGFAGLAVAAKAEGRFAGTVLALLLCLGAVFTKQSLLSFGVAVAVLSLVRRPGPAGAAVLLVGLVGGVATLALEAATGGGFLANVVGGNVNRFSMRFAAIYVRNHGSTLWPLVPALAAGAWLALRGMGPVGWRGLRRADAVTWRRALILAQLVLSFLSLAALVKAGGYLNYLLELCGAVAIVTGVALGSMPDRQGVFRAVLLASLAGGAALLPSWSWVRAGVATAEIERQDAALVARIAAAGKPVAAERMTLLMRAGVGVTYEPAIVTELALTGRWDEAPLVAMVRGHGFAFMLTTDDGSTATDRRTPAVTAAMREAYPRATELRDGLWLHEP